MVLLVEKLGLFPIKFPSKPEDYHPKKSISLAGFRSEISNFVTKILLNPGTSRSLSLELFQNCFELINITNRAFAKLVVEINHPTSQWSGKLTDSYLGYTLSLLDLVNSVTTSLSHLNQAKMSVFHAVSLMKNNSPASAAKYLKKIPTGNIQAMISISGFNGEIPVSDRKERVVLQSLMVVKKIGFLAMGFVVSGLYSDPKMYLDIRRLIPGFLDDPLIKLLDSRFRKEMTEIQGEMEEVKEVNLAVEVLSQAITSAGRITDAVGELDKRLMVLENSMHGIEKHANNLFSEVLDRRNKLIDNIRFMG